MSTCWRRATTSATVPFLQVTSCPESTTAAVGVRSRPCPPLSQARHALNQPGGRADDDPVTQAFVLRKSSLNEEEFNKYISHRLGPGAFGYYSGSNSMDGSYTAGRGNSMTNGASPCAPTLCPIACAHALQHSVHAGAFAWTWLASARLLLVF